MTGPEPGSDRPAEDSAGNAWTVTPCSAEPGRLSEGPRWDGARNELLWVDVLAGRLHRARPGADGHLRVLTVDHQGNIWVALWDGGALARYHPDGSLLTIVPLPVDRPTSCAFGDAGGGTLFVTTARDGLNEDALARQPDAGRLLRVDSLGVTGPPCEPYRGHATNG